VFQNIIKIRKNQGNSGKIRGVQAKSEKIQEKYKYFQETVLPRLIYKPTPTEISPNPVPPTCPPLLDHRLLLSLTMN
jgi:hypothetical protein